MAPNLHGRVIVRLHLRALPPLLSFPRIQDLVCRSPWLFTGETVHHAGLRALATGDLTRAGHLFEVAAGRYRQELRTVPLARVRVHQLMALARAAGGRFSPLSLEVDRALTRLDLIELPAPPFALVPAHLLLASWVDGTWDETPVEPDAPLELAA